MTLTNRFARTSVFFAIASALLAIFLLVVSVPPAQSAPKLTSIQNAIDGASDGATIDITAGIYNESLTVNKNLTLTGALSSTTIIQAMSGQRVITVTAGHNLRIENLTVTSGQAGTDDGGGIRVENGNLTVVNSRITNNSARYGGGIHGGDATKRVEVIGSILELNHANFDGGAVYAFGNAVFTNTQVLSNTAGQDGGGVMISNGRGDLSGGIFRNNTAARDGGAVNVNNSISITGTQFISNTASRYGGGLHQWNMGPSVSILSARFERNTSVYKEGADASKGGGMRAGGATTISGTVFLSNSVSNNVLGSYIKVYGGGAHISNTLQVKASTFTGNEALCTDCGFPSGGAISIEGSGASAVIEDSVFEKGWAWRGAGVFGYESGLGSVTVRRSTFRDNSGGYGAGVWTADAQVENSNFLRNSAVWEGGGLDAQTAVVTATRFISNTVGDAPGGGGGGIGIRGHMDGTNLLFAENQGANESAVADLFYWGAVATPGNLRHVTIAHPSMSASPAIAVPVGTLNIRNTILVSHTVGISLTGGTVNVDYALFFGGTATQLDGGTLITGTHILTGDPQFVNPAAGDYHLMPTSPAIDYGTNLGVTKDLDGNPRPVGASPDLGAYEFGSLPQLLPKLYLPFLRKN